jgi:hypothetical protein
MYKAVETIPFFLFNMYSTRQHQNDTTYSTSIYINGNPFNVNTLAGYEKETLLGSLSYYRKLKENGFFATDSQTIRKRLEGKIPGSWYDLFYKRLTNTSVNDEQFFNWWSKYLSRVSDQKVDSFSIIQSSVVWKPAYHLLHDTVSRISYVPKK